MKRYISTRHMDEKETAKVIIQGFGERFGFMPSATTINKYQLFNENNPPKEEEPEDIGGEEGTVATKTKDTRLTKELVDFSDGIEEEEFERLCRNIEKSKRDTWDLLAEATRRGYTKVDIATGEIEK